MAAQRVDNIPSSGECSRTAERRQVDGSVNLQECLVHSWRQDQLRQMKSQPLRSPQPEEGAVLAGTQS